MKNPGILYWILLSNFIVFVRLFSFELKIEHSGEDRFSFSLDYSSAKSLTDSIIRLEFDDHFKLGKPGYPNLPVKTFTLAIPPYGMPRVIYIVLDSVFYDGIYIPPAESIYYKDERREDYERIYVENPQIYGISRYFPDEFVKLEYIGYFRSQRIATVAVYPIRYNPLMKRAIMARKLSINIIFGEVRGKGGYIDEKGYEAVLGANVMNYEKGKMWRRKRIARVSKGDIFGETNEWVRIKIESEGIYKLTGTDLERRGMNISEINPRKLRLFEFINDTIKTQLPTDSMPNMVEIPIETYGLDDMRFDRNDYILFYARGPSGWRIRSDGKINYFIHPYTKSYSLWLSLNGNIDGKRIFEVNYPDDNAVEIRSTYFKRHFEADLLWQGGINWAWDRFSSRKFFFFDPFVVPGETAYVFVKPSCSYVLVDSVRASYLAGIDGFSINSLNTRADITIAYAGENILDWFEVKYKRALNADNNELLFFSPETPGKYRYNIRNFSSQPKVYDITDPENVRSFSTQPGSIGSGEYFFIDSIGIQKRIYIALTQQALKVPVSIEIFRMNSLRDTGNSAEMLILTADELDPSRLAQFHTEHDSMIVRVVKLSEIMNQFGFGIYNPVAVRDFIYYAYNFWSEPNLKYVILVGDGHYDYRNILNSPPIYFPPAACDSYFSDDFFVRVTDSTSGLPSVAIGRLPARSQGELDVIMGKIIAYVKEPEWGFWRNTFILAGDDEYVGYEGNQPEHTLQTDELRKFIYTLANIRNLFMIEFPMSSSLTKPLAREELIKMWNEGAVVVNYIGHGNYHLWAHEILFDSNSDVVRLNNKKKLSLMFSASCSVGEFYEPFRESTSEKLLRHPEGGTIISIGATGLTGSDANFSLNSRFFKKLFIQSPSLSCGLNFISAKLEGGGLYRMNDSQYLIIGDPALHLAIPPTCGFSFTVQPESFEAPCWIELHIASPSGFQGNAEIHAFDSEMEKRYAVGGNASMIIEYHKQGNPIFRGFGSINGTGLDMSFFVPKDVNYGSSGAKVVGYIVNQTGDCICGRDSISITGSTLITIIDTTGPEITIWLDDRSFVSGDTVSSEPILFAELSDTHGINITGAPGHSITMWIDNEASAEDLAPYFNYYEGSATKGSIRYKIGKIPQGTHTITIRAWDNLNNSSTKTVNFFVSEVGTIAIANILPYPSPFKNYTYLTFRLLKSGLVSVDIFTITGRKIWSSDEQYLERGFNMIRWDGIDKNGKKVAKGVYIYRMVAKDGTKDYILYGKLLKE